MITPNAPPKVEPFAYTAPALSGPPVTEQADLDAHPDTLRPAWNIYTKATAIVERVTAEAERIAKDPNRSEAGKEAAFTRLLLEPVAPRTPGPLPALKDLLSKLDAPEAVAMAQAEQVQKVAAVPEPTESDERIAEAFGRRNEKQRILMLESAMIGKDPKLLKALATAHHSLSGLGAPTLVILRGQLEDAQIDPVAAARVKDVASKLGTVRRTVNAAIQAFENAADRTQLKAAGLATQRRSDFPTAKAKADWIDQHGLAAYKQLPA
jgi:hypothetical protein